MKNNSIEKMKTTIRTKQHSKRMQLQSLRLLLMVILLVSCSGRSVIQEDVPVSVLDKTSEESYSMIVPITVSNTRDYHAMYLRSSYDFQNIGTRLMELSKKYFSPTEYYMGEGTIITYDRLLALVKRVSGTYEQGLNPEADALFPTGKEGVSIENAVIVSDVVEQNYFKKTETGYDLAGISLSIILNPTHEITTNNTTYQVQISEEILYEYGVEMGRKLERYMRTIGEVKNLPILITVYVKSTNSSYIPGKMIAKAYFKDRSPSFDKLNEVWYLFPSDAVSKLDNDNASQFNLLKQSLANFITEDIGVVGYGFYENNQLKKLSIDIEVNAKTYMELMGVIRYSSELLQTFYNTDFDIELEIKTMNVTKAIVLKSKGKNQIQPIILN